jgi:hypothetical protein
MKKDSKIHDTAKSFEKTLSTAIPNIGQDPPEAVAGQQHSEAVKLSTAFLKLDLHGQTLGKRLVELQSKLRSNKLIGAMVDIVAHAHLKNLTDEEKARLGVSSKQPDRRTTARSERFVLACNAIKPFEKDLANYVSPLSCEAHARALLCLSDLDQQRHVLEWACTAQQQRHPKRGAVVLQPDSKYLFAAIAGTRKGLHMDSTDPCRGLEFSPETKTDSQKTGPLRINWELPHADAEEILRLVETKLKEATGEYRQVLLRIRTSLIALLPKDTSKLAEVLPEASAHSWTASGTSTEPMKAASQDFVAVYNALQEDWKSLQPARRSAIGQAKAILAVLSELSEDHRRQLEASPKAREEGSPIWDRIALIEDFVMAIDAVYPEA